LIFHHSSNVTLNTSLLSLIKRISSMRRMFLFVWAILLAATPLNAAFTPANAIPLEIIGSAAAYSDGYSAGRLIDGDPKTEYASENRGTNTFVEFRLPALTNIVAFRHLDRADRAVVGISELIFSDDAGHEVKRVRINHADRKSGETFFIFPSPVLASRVRWQVVRLGATSLGSVGGAELQLFSAGESEAAPIADTVQARALPFVDKQGLQPVQITATHPYFEPTQARLRFGNGKSKNVELKHGENVFTVNLPAVQEKTVREIKLELSATLAKTALLEQVRVRPMTIYILPHSHTDVGYTALQSAVEARQVANLQRGIELARRTANYPEGAHFVWNVEVLWVADLFLQRADAESRAEFFDAVKRGDVELNGMYLNELTGLCRPEELCQLFRYATQLSEQTGKKIQSAMISDVPGYTWGTVTALAQAGIRYLSAGPNYGERAFMREWADKPFYWIGPDGKSKVLVWIPFRGYALEHIYDSLSPRLLDDLCTRLQAPSQPYDVAYIRWAGHGDNGLPDSDLCDSVRDWNATHRSPQFVISGTTEAFRTLEARYGKQLPEYRGDWTPYWEDGAGSSARETALNRNTSERLTQAQTLFAMLNPSAYPKAEFDDAWRNVLLFSEHTWGAAGSVTQPDDKQSLAQWARKKQYAEDAANATRRLVSEALAAPAGERSGEENEIEVINSLSWPRGGLVVVPAELSRVGDRVSDQSGHILPSQRLRSGELAFLANDIPAFGSTRYQIQAGPAASPVRPVHVFRGCLENGLLRVAVDEISGGIRELEVAGLKHNFAAADSAGQLNQYIYLRGNDWNRPQTNGPVKISVYENGPLVASLRIDSDAPGCRHLQRELRLIAGQKFLELINRVDKARLNVPSYRPPSGKESVSFAFPFNVPDASVRLDIPLATMSPETDQLPASCDRWFTVGRWVNIFNSRYGMSWVTLDAPLVQFNDPAAAFRDHLAKHFRKSSNLLYSWIMNNRWGTNYKPYQEGLTEFRYVLRPFGTNDESETTRFAIQFDQPLLVRRAVNSNRETGRDFSLPQLDSKNVIVSAAKPSDDGRALIFRLFAAGEQASTVSLSWPKGKPKRLFLSDTSEKPLAVATNPLSIPGHGLITLRAEFE
jgi:hypothetical protein